MNEKQQITKILKGDTSAFSYFVDTYQDMAVTIAFRICGNKQDAEDIVQNAFVKAFRNLHTFQAHSKFSTWFYRIVYNTAVTEIKTFNYNAEFVDYKVVDDNALSESDTMQQIEDKEQKAIVNEALMKMPKEESLLLTLYYLEDNSVKDIAQIIGLTETNIKVKLHRARKRFSEIISLMMKKEVSLI